MYDVGWYDELSNVHIRLEDISGSSICEQNVFPAAPMIFQKVLNPGDSIEVQRTLPLADDLDSRYNSNLLEQEFVIEVDFQYTDSNWDSSSSKTYVVTYPLEIEMVCNDYESYITEYLDIQVTTDKVSYIQGEDVAFTITVTNTGVYPIYMYDTGWCDNLSNVHVGLEDASGASIIHPDDLFIYGDIIFASILNSGETITVQRIFPLADDLDNRYSGNLLEQEFVMEVAFRYTDSNWDSSLSKKKVVTFPIKIYVE